MYPIHVSADRFPATNTYKSNVGSLTDGDQGWAPAVEEQAVDRVHRLGQTRPTKVYRLVIKGAVEESVIRIQDRKRELVGTAFQEDFKSLGKSHFADMIQELLY